MSPTLNRSSLEIKDNRRGRRACSLGTNADNAADKMYKERYQGKLTAAQVREIRALFPAWKFGMGKEVARKYGVSEVVICKLRQGETYQHVT